MTSQEIRQSFLDFFASRKHKIVPSASLLPTAPNLLFTNAGMNPFVPYFLGERAAPDPRVADTQKCIRAGGKHNDLEDVGFDSYHHTFFEMLGNWSFDDYFKKEAIGWAWELLTEVWGFPKERLYATVYKPGPGDPAEFDREAYDHWKAVFQAAGLDPEVHIRHGDKADNFWMMGDTGPCGPCSEIHIDLTPGGDTGGELVNRDSAWCMEIWNLVFIQFNADSQGDFSPLAAKHVDTGMGFERIAGILAATKNFTDFSQPPSNYESDLFTSIFDRVSSLSGKTYRGTLPESREGVLSERESDDVAFRVLADHIRTLACSIADGILPGNEGRNYVLRRILRRAVHFGRRLGMEPGFFEKLIDPVVEKLGDTFPELRRQEEVIHKVIRAEEETFSRTLDRGMQLFHGIADKAVDGVIAGSDAFTLYDTYGFPLDLTQILARERGLTVDTAGFESEMDRQRQRARAAQKKTEIKVASGDESAGATPFTGYEITSPGPFPVTVTEIIRQDDATWLIFDQSPFYAEMGGQLGDTGTLRADSLALRITDTQKDAAGRILHRSESDVPASLAGQSAEVTLDLDRRHAIERHHTATHLLHFALRDIVGDHVHQAGSLVAPDRLRFDFSHFEPVSPEQIQRIETIVNRRILDNDGVKAYEIDFADKPDDIIAFFGEKYGERVRVVDIGGYSKELCGGTHVGATGEVGPFKITAESGIAAGTRRLEAIAGNAALELLSDSHARLQNLSRRLSCRPDELESRLEQLRAETERLEKEVRKTRQRETAAQAGDLASRAADRNGLKTVAAKVDAGSPDELRSLGMQILGEIGEGLVVLGAGFGEKSTLVALASPQAVKAGHRAGDIIRELAPQLGGKGGGKPDFAMGGGKHPEKLEAVLQAWSAKG